MFVLTAFLSLVFFPCYATTESCFYSDSDVFTLDFLLEFQYLEVAFF